jgi:hypothetical protein
MIVKMVNEALLEIEQPALIGQAARHRILRCLSKQLELEPYKFRQDKDREEKSKEQGKEPSKIADL